MHIFWLLKSHSNFSDPTQSPLNLHLDIYITLKTKLHKVKLIMKLRRHWMIAYKTTIKMKVEIKIPAWFIKKTFEYDRQQQTTSTKWQAFDGRHVHLEYVLIKHVCKRSTLPQPWTMVWHYTIRTNWRKKITLNLIW